MVRQSYTRLEANNPKAKYKMNYIRYRIYNKDGSYTYGKKYITRKNDEWVNKENKSIL